MLIAALALLLLWASSEQLAAFGGRPSDADLARMQRSARYESRSRQFQNAEPTELLKVGTWASLRNWLVVREMRVPNCRLPMATNTAAQFARPPKTGLRVTWLGHSTTLIEIDGVRVLSDPIWSERASPSSLAGPRRFHPPPLPIAALPKLDAVIISHDHYDHLDMDTVKRLARRGVAFHVPLGVGAHLARWGVRAAQIHEHDWWEVIALPHGVKLIATPARHFSGRRLLDRDATLWTSWTLIGPQHRAFFSGDTGATQAHAEIARRYGPFDIALLEIGQYHWSWGDIHLGPSAALAAYAALHAKTLLPIHWATFELALHAWSEPAETISVEAAERGVALLTPQLGEAIEPTQPNHTTAWWRALPPIAARCP
jgi:L-ascorbate metabolism protein UlaG (beta-lactamase superfamily)